MSTVNLGYSLSNASTFSLGSSSPNGQNNSIGNFDFRLPPFRNSYHRPLDFTISVPNHLNALFQRGITTAAPEDEINSEKERELIGSLALRSTGVVRGFVGVTRRISTIFNRIHGIENPPSLDALGMTKIFSLVTGLLNVKRGSHDVAMAQENSDVTGVALGGLKMAKGSVSALGGAFYIPSFILSFTAEGSKLAVALKGLRGVFANVSGILTGATLGIQSYELQKFYRSLDTILKDPEISEALRPVRALEFLKQEIAASPENKAFLQRVLSGKCIKMILEKGPPEANSVIEAIEHEVRVKTFVCALTAVGLSLIIGSFACTGSPLALSVLEMVALLLALTRLVMSSHNLYSDLKEGTPGRFDKLWILLSSVIAVTAVSLAFFLSTGMAPVITAATVGAVWLAINATCSYRLQQLENQACAET